MSSSKATRKGLNKTQDVKKSILPAESEKILVVDDDKVIIEFFKTILKDLHYQFTCTISPKEGLTLLSQETFSLAIVDYLMPEMDGLHFLKKAKERHPDLEVIMMTGLHDVKNAIEALRLGAYDYLLKPFQIDEIKIAIKRALEHRALVIAHKNYEQELQKRIKEATQQLKSANEKLRETKEYLEQLLNTSGDGILILTPSLRVNYANNGALRILNFKDEEIKNKLLSSFLAGTKEEAKYIKQIILEKGSVQNYETEFIRKNKSQVPVNISFSCLKKEQKIHSILAIFKDITTQKELEHKLKEMSIKDGLTDLYNQRYFYDRLEAEIERAKRQRHPLSLLLFDIDQFKTYNDCHGHLEGDKVLKAVGQIVRECTREHVDIGFRYGGDEFTVILPETDVNQAVLVADRIRSSFEAKNFNNLTLSIGVIGYKEKFSVRSFIRFADNCMYNAKRSGGNRINIFQDK